MTDPSHNLIETESDRLFTCYCTFINNIKGKKLSTQNVFVETLSTPKFKNILKEILNLDTDYQVVRLFLDADPTLAKSKIVINFLNKLSNDVE